MTKNNYELFFTYKLSTYIIVTTRVYILIEKCIHKDFLKLL